jgi:biotin operon repressor
LEASCYTIALEKYLESQGITIEAGDDEGRGCEVKGTLKTEEKIEKSPVTGPSTNPIIVVPFRYTVLEVYDLLKEGEYTLAELASKTKIKEATVKQYINYTFKNAGYFVRGYALPGKGIVYTLKEV